MDKKQLGADILAYWDSRTPEQLEYAKLMYQGAKDGAAFAEAFCKLALALDASGIRWRKNEAVVS